MKVLLDVDSAFCICILGFCSCVLCISDCVLCFSCCILSLNVIVLGVWGPPYNGVSRSWKNLFVKWNALSPWTYKSFVMFHSFLIVFLFCLGFYIRHIPPVYSFIPRTMCHGFFSTCVLSLALSWVVCLKSCLLVIDWSYLQPARILFSSWKPNNKPYKSTMNIFFYWWVT